MMYQMKQREAELRGEVKGRAEGREENAIETAKRMLQEALPVDMIVRISGLPLTEVNALKAQMAH